MQISFDIPVDLNTSDKMKFIL